MNVQALGYSTYKMDTSQSFNYFLVPTKHITTMLLVRLMMGNLLYTIVG